MTNITRMMVESVSKYSAAPPQIPQILLSYNDFVSRFFHFCIFFLFPCSFDEVYRRSLPAFVNIFFC